MSKKQIDISKLVRGGYLDQKLVKAQIEKENQELHRLFNHPKLLIEELDLLKTKLLKIEDMGFEIDEMPAHLQEEYLKLREKHFILASYYFEL